MYILRGLQAYLVDKLPKKNKYAKGEKSDNGNDVN